MLVFFCLASAAFLPFLDAGRGLFHSLGIYTRDWMFNSPLHTLLLQLVKNNQIARLIAAVIFIAIATGIYYGYFKNQNREEPETAYHICFMLLGAFLLCTPVVHPWYICWMIPFLAIAPNRAWLFLSGAVFGSYWVLGSMQQPACGWNLRQCCAPSTFPFSCCSCLIVAARCVKGKNHAHSPDIPDRLHVDGLYHAQPCNAAGDNSTFSGLAQSLLEHVKYGEPHAEELTALRIADPSALCAELQTDSLKKTFWINLYNAFAQIQIQKNAALYNDRTAFFQSKNFTVAGHSLSLDDIEHRMLRRAEPGFLPDSYGPFSCPGSCAG